MCCAGCVSFRFVHLHINGYYDGNGEANRYDLIENRDGIDSPSALSITIRFTTGTT